MTMTEKFRIAVAGVVTFFGVLVFAATLVHAVWYAPSDTTVDPKVGEHTTASATSTPARLKIAALGIDANVQHVGRGHTGNMAVPTNFTDVGWYRYGPTPGQAGSAVFDGHVDNGLGLPGVFKHLASIKPDDDIEVDDTSGSALHFTVSDIKTYPYQSVPTGLIFSNTGAPMLVLITCEGTWVSGGDTYDHRLVVFARLNS